MAAQRVVITRAGGPEVLQIEPFEPAAPGPGEVALDVRAAGVNFADLFCRLGLYKAAPPIPFTCGFEVAGVVAATGEGVLEPPPGERVIAVLRFGGYASRVNVPAGQVKPIPAGWSFEQAAAFPVVFLTAWHGLVNLGRLAAGETVVVHSAAGGVGTAACQIARALGARVIGTVGSEEKRAAALRAGANEVVVSTGNDVWGEVRRLAGGVDLILDAVGGPGLRRGYESLRIGGRLIVFGFAEMMPKGGRRNWPALAWRRLRTPRFSPFSLTFQNRTVAGFNLVHLFGRAELLGGAWRRLEELATAGRIQPVIGATFPLAEAPAAHALVQSRRSTGKVVLIIPAV